MELTDPRLLYAFTAIAVLVGIIIPISLIYFVVRQVRADFPGKKLINELRAETAAFSGEVADLTERFSRFQKREGMRVARDEKQAQRTLKEQAQQIMAQNAAGAGVPQDPAEAKRQLRMRARGFNS